MSKEALEQSADAINGSTVPMLGIEHDLTLPPIGKWVNANVEKLADGEYGLFGQNVMYQDSFREETVLSNGSKVIIESYSDKRPFTSRSEDIPEEIKFSYDITNFESEDDRKSFDKYLQEINGATSDFLLRKSLIPDPELIINLSRDAIAAFATYKVVQKTGQKVGNAVSEDLFKIYTNIRNVAISYSKLCFPKNRPITYVIQDNSEFEKEFVVRTADPNSLEAAIKMENLSSALEEAKNYKETFDADKVQFIFVPEIGWQFNYLLTSSGQVVGSPDAIKRREKAVELMLNSSPESRT